MTHDVTEVVPRAGRDFQQAFFLNTFQQVNEVWRDAYNAFFQRIPGQRSGQGPREAGESEAGQYLKKGGRAGFQRQGDTTIGQLQVEFKLKDLKTGFHRTPGFSLSRHRSLRRHENQQRRPCKKALIPGVIDRTPISDREWIPNRDRFRCHFAVFRKVSKLYVYLFV